MHARRVTKLFITLSPSSLGAAAQMPSVAPVDATAVRDELRSKRLDVILPSDGDVFEHARRVWNADIDRRPAAIVRCRSSQDVAHAIRCCVLLRVDCTVRGGGHNVAGSAVHDGAVLLDLSQLSRVELINGGAQVAVGGGATWAAVDAVTASVSRAVPAGLISHTGVGGLTLGGGVGWLSRHAGLTCDSLVSAEVVTASGDVLAVTETQHSDLFWALHGGGGNFGVVTQFMFRTTTISAVRVCQYIWETSDASLKRSILGQVAEMCQKAPNTTSIYSFLRQQMVMVVAVELLGVEKSSVDDTPAACFKILDQMAATWKSPLEIKSLPELNSFFDQGNAAGQCYRWSRSTFINAAPGLTPSTIANLVRAVDEADADGAAELNVQITHLGGAMDAQTPTATPFPHRSAAHEIHGIVTWAPNASQRSRAGKVDAIRAFSEAMGSIGSDTGFVNIQPCNERLSSKMDWLRIAYAQNLPRLQAVKRQYDPHNFFHHNHNVAPDVTAEDVPEWRPVTDSVPSADTNGIRTMSSGPPKPPLLPAHLERAPAVGMRPPEVHPKQTTCRWRCCFTGGPEARDVATEQVKSTGGLREQLQDKLASGLAPLSESDVQDRENFGVGYWCDLCSCRISSAEDWYRCSECEDFDVCLSCYDSHPQAPEQRTLHEHTCWREVALARRPSQQTVGSTCCDLVLHACTIYRDRYCLGVCDDLEPDGLRWLTYQEIERRAKGVACSVHAELRAELSAGSAEECMVGICAENCIEWLVTDLSCILSGVTSIPIDPPLAEAAIASVITDCSLRVIFCSFQCVSKLLDIAEASSSDGCLPLTKLIVFLGQRQADLDSTSNACKYRARASAVGIQIQLFSAFEERGLSRLDDDAGCYFETSACKGRDRQSDDICTIVYTSGSTGKPKGAILSDQILHRRIGNEFLVPTPLVVVSYLPLAHSFDRESCLSCFAKGGRIVFHRGAVSDIFTTLQTAKPTTFSSTPRLWNELHQQFLDSLASAQATDQTNATCTPIEILRKQCLASLRGILGGRTKSIGTGGAATSAEVLQFMRECFECSVVDGYGATEVGAIGWDGVQNTSCETKLIDRPDMGYTSADKPFPRGEICVKSPTGVAGYYKNEAETEAKFTPDGWYRTGDIGEKRSPGYIRVIDRVSDLFKLSGGEFVAPAHLEQLFEGEVRSVSQCWVTGVPHQASPIAVVVPAPEPALRWAHSVGPPHSQMTLHELCQDPQRTLAAHIHAAIAKVAEQKELPTHERPGLVLLVADPFTEENGTLTTTRKLQRQTLVKKYTVQLEELFVSETNEASSRAWAAELESIADGPMRRIMRAASMVLPLPPPEADSSPDDGEDLSSILLPNWLGDSITAVRLAAAINAEFGRGGTGDPSRLRPSALLEPAATLDQICRYMTGKEPDLVRTNWNAEGVLDASVQFTPNADLVPPLEHAWPEHVLLTGATGFLGAFVLAELLNSSTSAVTCLVRGTSPEEARARLCSILRGFGLLESESIAQRFVERVTVVAGNIGQFRLGMSEQAYAQLLGKHSDSNLPPIDAIVHCAARVSAVAPYVALKSDNVDGTFRLLHLAAQRPAGSVFFCHISTIGVLPDTMVESERGNVSPNHLHSNSGYNQSKWVAERFVVAAFERGLAGCIARPANIFGHSKNGASNVTDIVVRLLRGSFKLGSAPHLSNTSTHAQDITAVDDLARALVGTLSTASVRRSLQGRIMNMTAAVPTLTANLFAWVDSYRLGCGYRNLERLPLAQWIGDLRQAPDNDLHPFIDMIAAAGVPSCGRAGRGRSRAEDAIVLMGLDDFNPITESCVHATLAWFDSREEFASAGQVEGEGSK